MIELYTAKDLLKAFKSASLSCKSRPKFNFYEEQKIIPKSRYAIHVHNSNYFKNNMMRAYTKGDINRIVRIVREFEDRNLKAQKV